MASNSAVFADEGMYADKTWVAVDDYTLKHLNHHQHLDNILKDSRSAGLPPIATYPGLAKTLAMHCYATGVKHALEVGTLGGYTPIWLATLNPGIKVTTVEYDEEHARVARQNFEKVLGESWQDRVELFVGSGIEVLARLRKEVEAGKRERFGLTYIDADKVNNWSYFDSAVAMSYPRASVFVDNIVRQGHLVAGREDGSLDEGNLKDPSVLGSREVVERAGKDDRVEAVVLQTVSGKSWDGHMWAVVK